MSIPYENASSGEAAIGQIRKILTTFGCSKFGTMTDTEKAEVIVQFEYRGRKVSVQASAKGYAAVWLKEHPYRPQSRVTRVEWERRALDQGQVSIYSILRDWIKGQITAVECGILSFEAAFLGQILLPSGKTVMETAQDNGLLQITNAEERHEVHG